MKIFFTIFLSIFFIATNSEAYQLQTLSEKVDSKTSRILKNMVLISEEDPIYFALSLPQKISKKLSTIIVIAGLETGQKNLQYISDPGNYALIGYEYPSILKKKKIFFWDLFSLRKKMLHIPKDILQLTLEAQKSSWSNQKVSIAGYSFGAMFVPAVYHEAQKKGISLSPGIIAYAGADIYPLLCINFKGSRFTRFFKASIASFFLRPLNPASHLPYLQGEFLIINSKKDPNVPFYQAKKLQQLTPSPKTIVNLEENHLSPINTKVLEQVNKISKTWLDQKLP